jgi:hypothetical protein
MGYTAYGNVGNTAMETYIHTAQVKREALKGYP